MTKPRRTTSDDFHRARRVLLGATPEPPPAGSVTLAVLSVLNHAYDEGDDEQRREAYDLLLRLGAHMGSDGRWRGAERPR